MKYVQYEAPHPGAILLAFYINPLKLSLIAASQKLLITQKSLEEFLGGTSSVTESLATSLAREFGTTKQFWLNLQSSYTQRHKKDGAR